MKNTLYWSISYVPDVSSTQIYELVAGNQPNGSEQRRGRFTAPTADLSAFVGYSAIPINLLNRIIGPTPFLACCVGETDKYQHRP
jgi:hypothetical protein